MPSIFCFLFLLTIFLQEDSDSAITEQQLGFRRVLAGVYTHTSAHITAAPMAHFVAKTGSRFQYSHDTWHLPVDGLVHWLKDEQMQMTI